MYECTNFLFCSRPGAPGPGGAVDTKRSEAGNVRMYEHTGIPTECTKNVRNKKVMANVRKLMYGRTNNVRNNYAWEGRSQRDPPPFHLDPRGRSGAAAQVPADGACGARANLSPGGSLAVIGARPLLVGGHIEGSMQKI